MPDGYYTHDVCVIGHVLWGSRSLQLNGRPVQIGPGDAVVFNPGDVHGCDQLDETPFAYDSVTVAADVFDGVRLRCPAAGDVAAISAVDALMAAMEGLSSYVLIRTLSGGQAVATGIDGCAPIGYGLALLAAAVWTAYSLVVRRIADLGYETVTATKRTFFWGLVGIAPATLLFG